MLFVCLFDRVRLVVATGCRVHCGRLGAFWVCTAAPRVSVIGNLRGAFCSVAEFLSSVTVPKFVRVRCADL